MVISRTTVLKITLGNEEVEQVKNLFIGTANFGEGTSDSEIIRRVEIYLPVNYKRKLQSLCIYIGLSSTVS